MRIRGFLGRFGRETKGIASLEFVLILFPMMLIFFGVIQIGGAFYYYHQMQNAVRDTARRMATDLDFHPETASAPTVLCSAAAADTAGEYGCDYLTIPGTKTDIASGYCKENQPSSTVVARYHAVVQMSAPLADVSLVDLLGIAGNRRITATAVLRVDPAKHVKLASSDTRPFNIRLCVLEGPPLFNP